MEGAPLVDNTEQLSQPNLLEAFAEREVTLFGITGTFKDLADLCPIDLNDPRVSQEAKNEFVVKAANEAGLEIEPEYKAVFDQIIQKNGLEPKFTVVEPTKAQTREPAVVETATQQRQVLAAADSKTPVIDWQLEQQRQLIERAILPTPEVPKTVAPAAEVVSIETMPEVKLPKPKIEVVADSSASKRQILERVIQIAPIETVVIEESPVAKTAEAQEPDSMILEVTAPETEVTASEPGPEEFIVNERIIETLSLPMTLREVTESAEIVDQWAAELTKEPLEIYEDFTVAFEAFAELAMLPLVVDETAEPMPMPPIITVLSEQLAELEPDAQELVAPILKDIVGAIHGLELLKISDAEPEAIAAVEAQLEKLCITLFEALNIDYSEKDIKQLILVLRHPEFKLIPAAEIELLDLERVGTREAKRRMPPLSGRHIKSQLQHLLGMTALLHASPA